MATRRMFALLAGATALIVWSLAYFVWPRISFDDGPFLALPFERDIRELQTLSSANLTVFGVTAFVLETRITEDYVPKTVFVLRHRDGVVSWAKATSTEFGRIQFLANSERWFLPGGWVVGIKPERTESGELYISPIGGFRFFFHSW